MKMLCFVCHVFRAWLITAFGLRVSIFHLCCLTFGFCFLFIRTTFNVQTIVMCLLQMCDSPRTGYTWRATPIYMCRKHAEIEWARRGMSIVACCHSVKLCILAAWAFQSLQSGPLTRMWRWCQVQPSQKECATGTVHSKKEGTLL